MEFSILFFHNANYLDPQTLSLDLPLTWKNKVKKVSGFDIANKF